jgi:hypothetical protein
MVAATVKQRSNNIFRGELLRRIQFELRSQLLNNKKGLEPKKI